MSVLEKEIIVNSCKLNPEGRLKVLKRIAEYGCKIHEHSDGSRVNLSELSEPQLFEIDAMIQELITKVPHKYQIE